MKQSRLTEIRRLLLQQKKLSCDFLCEHFNVSIATIRRDLDLLEKEGTVRRYYGGAEIIERNEDAIITDIIPSWASRESTHFLEKQAIAREVAAMIPDSCTVYLDSGTTVFEVARLLSYRKNLTLITNSIRAAALLGMNQELQVYCIGGNIKADMLTTSGVLANEGLAFFSNIDICVLSADGFAKSWGIREWSMENALLKKAAADRSKKLIVTIDHTKFNSTAPSPVCPTKQIDTLVTDSLISPDIVESLEKSGVNVVVAKM